MLIISSCVLECHCRLDTLYLLRKDSKIIILLVNVEDILITQFFEFRVQALNNLFPLLHYAQIALMHIIGLE